MNLAAMFCIVYLDTGFEFMVMNDYIPIVWGLITTALIFMLP